MVSKFKMKFDNFFNYSFLIITFRHYFKIFKKFSEYFYILVLYTTYSPFTKVLINLQGSSCIKKKVNFLYILAK